MKIPILLFLVLLGFSASAQTIYAPIYAQWHYEHMTEEPASNYYIHYSVSKVKVAYNGKSCSMITGLKHTPTAAPVSVPVTYVYTNGDSVFYYNEVFNEFFPLYIYNVNEGDVLSFHVPDKRPLTGNPDSFRVKIVKVDTVKISGVDLRSITTAPVAGSPYYLGTYVERLGALGGAGIIGILPSATTLMHRDALRCHKDDDIDVLFKPATSCDYLPTSIPEQHGAGELALYPNPVSGLLTIGSLTQSCTATITDMLGHTILTRQLQAAANTSIPVSQLVPGVYYLNIRNTDGTVSGYRKFVKE